MSRHRVVVTGMGVVSPLGNRVDAFCEALLAGRSGIAEITSFDASNLPTHIAGEAQLPSDAPLGDRKIAFALEAARQALEDAGRGASSGSSEIDAHAGVSLGVGLELFNMPDLVRSRAPGFGDVRGEIGDPLEVTRCREPVDRALDLGQPQPGDRARADPR
ncbi:MAG: hypothetical protein KC492_37885, partial [Myxococcales bacterium]|nr:hypothetical protein [Myxococcales bacterium]